MVEYENSTIRIYSIRIWGLFDLFDLFESNRDFIRSIQIDLFNLFESNIFEYGLYSPNMGYIRKNRMILCKYIQIYVNISYICIYSIYANLCESCKFTRIIRYWIYSKVLYANIKYMRIWGIYLHTFDMRIYANIIEKSNACEFIRSFAHA